MIQMVRSNADKLDLTLRHNLINLYKPFQWTPCFLHSSLEKWLKKTKKISVIAEFEKNCNFSSALDECRSVCKNHMRSKVKREFHHTRCCSMDLSPAALEDLLSSCSSIQKLYFDREVQALLDVATPSSRAEGVVRQGTTLTGKDVTIAIIDTGIYPHPDLENRIVAFKDFVNNRDNAYDDNGHGTHCAGDAAGNGRSSDGLYKGPAPNANVVGVKVLDKLGSGSLSTVMAGVEWCIDYNQENPNNKIDIISMSLGSTPQRYSSVKDDPMVKAVEAAWDQGIVVCVAAGNSGPDPGTIASPGISELVITVGAMDDRNTVTRGDDTIAVFSSKGPTIYGHDKPDVVAPGVNVVSLRSPNSYLDKLQKSNRVGSQYFSLSGTSMATPICAGVVALIIEHNRNLTPKQVKKQLLKGADPWGEVNTYGKGYVNAERSIPN